MDEVQSNSWGQPETPSLRPRAPSDALRSSLSPRCAAQKRSKRLRERLPERVVEVLALAVGILVDVYDRNRSKHETEAGRAGEAYRV